jgi:transcriptional regulator with XRE-family HTH domain
MLGLSQRQLAQQIGVSSQQVYRYEGAEDSISAGGLYELARVLEVPITYFYEGFDDWRPLQTHRRMLLNFVRLLGKIQDEKRLEVLSQLIRLLVDR